MVVPLKKPILAHFAEDLSAISLFEELEDDDVGLIVHKDTTVNGNIIANSSVLIKLNIEVEKDESFYDTLTHLGWTDCLLL